MTPVLLVCVCVCVCMCMCMCMRLCVCVFVRWCVYTHTHSHENGCAPAPCNEGVANSRYNSLNSTEDGVTDGADAEDVSCHHEEDVWRMWRGRTARDKSALKP